MKNEEKKYPEGHFIALGIGIGMAAFSVLGIIISIITGSYTMIAIGPGIGVGVGVAFGAALEEKMKKEGKIRAQTKEEKSGKRKALLIGLAVFAVVLVVAVLLFLSKSK